MTFIRKFSPLENSYLALDDDQHSPMCNQYVVEGVGGFSHLHWKSALEKVLEANPGLALMLRGHWIWRRWESGGKGARVRAGNEWHDSAFWNGQESHKAFFDGSRLDCLGGEVAEIILVEGDFPKVIFRTHHALMDGNATLFWIREMFRALREENLLGSYCEDNERQVLNQRPELVGRDFSGPWEPVFDVRKSLISENDDARYRSHWLNVQFREPPIRAVVKTLEFLKQRIQVRSPGSKMIFRVPSDLRRLLPVEDPFLMSNCVAALDFELGAEDTEQSINRKILKGLHQKQDLNIFPKAYDWGNLLPKAAFKPRFGHFDKLYQENHCDITAIVTHVGKISLAELSTPDFKATNIYAIPVPLPGVSLSCVFIAHDQALSCCLAAPHAYGGLEELHSLAAEMADYFSSAEQADNAQRKQV